MAPPKGNQFWKARSSHGRTPTFTDHESLLSASIEYMQWCEDNPLRESKIVKYKDFHELVEVPKLRAMTIKGLCIFLGISRDQLRNYSRKSDDFLAVVKNIKEMIYEQKFTGAAAGLLNSNIIARDLGLKDASEPVKVVVNNEVKVDDDTLKDRGIPIPEVGLEDVDD